MSLRRDTECTCSTYAGRHSDDCPMSKLFNPKEEKRNMSLQDDAKQWEPIIDAAAEGKTVTAYGEPILSLFLACYTSPDGQLIHPSPKDIKIVEPPRFIPWESVEDMGEAVNDWFRVIGSSAKDKAARQLVNTIEINGVLMRMTELFNEFAGNALDFI